MMIARVTGATRVLGKSQGYLGLPVRDEYRTCFIDGDIHSCKAMITAWEPTPEEIERIVAGAPVLLCLLGEAHPPAMIDVGIAPDG